MAGKYDEFDKLFYGKKNEPSQLEKNQKTINNYSARLAASGVDPNEALDKRNWLEKSLNLTPDQNFVFDIFELLQRPQNALFSGIDSWQQGEDFLEGAKQGIKGEKNTDFKKVLMNTGGFEDTEGKIDLVDALGFAGDVFLDPVNIPVIPGLKAGKLSSLDDALGMATKKVVKGGAKLADTGIEKGLAKLDAVKGVRDKAGNIVKLGYENPQSGKVSELVKYVRNKGDLAGKGAVVPRGRLENYVGLKEDLTNMFKVPEKTKQAILKGREVDTDVENFKKQLGVKIGEKNKEVSNSAKIFLDKAKNTTDPALKKVYEKIGTNDGLNKSLMLLSESNLDRSMSRQDILKLAKSRKLEASEGAIKALQDLAEDIPEDLRDGLTISTTKGGKIKLGSGWNDKVLKNTKGFAGFDPEKLAGKVDLGSMYSEGSKEEINALKQLYNTDADFKNIADSVIGDMWTGGQRGSFVDEINKMIDDSGFSTKLAEQYAPETNIGYAPHTMNFSWNDVKDFDNIPEGMLKGNTGVLADRTLVGSARERNEIWQSQLNKNYDKLDDTKKKFVDAHQNLFEENYLKAVENRYFNQLSSTLKENKMVNDILIDQTFGNEETLKRVKTLQKDMNKASKAGNKETLNKLNKEYNELTKDLNIKFLTKYDDKIPTGYTRIKGDTLKDMTAKFRTIGSQLGTTDKMEDLLKVISSQKGGIAIDNNILRMLQVTTDTKNMNALTRAYTGWLNHFKKWKTASPSFLMNNLVGNSSNLYLGGINYTEQARLGPKVADIITNGEKYSNMALRGQKLSKKQAEIADLYNQANKIGILGSKGSLTALNVQDMPESVLKYFRDGTKPKGKEWVKEAIPYFNNLANQKMDAWARLTVMLKATDDPNFIKNLGIKTTGSEGIRDAVAKIMFDPDMMTDFEKNTMKKIVPFYTYAKNNLVFHLDNMGQNLGRYQRTLAGVKGLQEMATDGNEEDMADYLKNSLYIPIPGLTKDGKYTLLRANLPFGQVLELADDPLQELVNMTSPLIKTPYELATNTSVFTGRDIEKFPGQKSTTLPFLTKKQETLLSGFSGLDVPLKTATRLIEGTTSDNPLGGLQNAFTMSGSVDTDKLNKTYEQITDLQNLMKQYEQKGYSFSTISELRKANQNNNVSSINAILDRYGVATTNSRKKSTYSDFDELFYK